MNGGSGAWEEKKKQIKNLRQIGLFTGQLMVAHCSGHVIAVVYFQA